MILGTSWNNFGQAAKDRALAIPGRPVPKSMQLTPEQAARLERWRRFQKGELIELEALMEQAPE